MKILSEHLESLRELYINQLRHMYSAETQIMEALPKLTKASLDPDLKSALETHLQETRAQAVRLEQILGRVEGSNKSQKNKGMAALLMEGDDIVTDATAPTVRDAAIIAAAQKVEHYEIAAYGTLRRYAEILGQTRDVSLLQETLQEEKHADELLSRIAGNANVRADRAA
jgi:ferritin-like metal-binding protein YciE